MYMNVLIVHAFLDRVWSYKIKKVLKHFLLFSPFVSLLEQIFFSHKKSMGLKYPEIWADFGSEGTFRF
jgi:hypothetical protein